MSTEDAVKKQAAYAGMGAAYGAITKHATGPGSSPGFPLATQVSSAVAAAARNGAGVSGSVAAGTAILTAKAVAVGTVATAAAPFVAGAAVVGGAAYGLYRLFKS